MGKEALEMARQHEAHIRMLHHQRAPLRDVAVRVHRHARESAADQFAEQKDTYDD